MTEPVANICPHCKQFMTYCKAEPMWVDSYYICPACGAVYPEKHIGAPDYRNVFEAYAKEVMRQ